MLLYNNTALNTNDFRPWFQYFSGPATPQTAVSASATLTQTIDVSSSASIISGGNVKFAVSAYLGAVIVAPIIYNGAAAQLTVVFNDAGGHTLLSTTLGPLPGGSSLRPPGAAISLQQQIGLVPAGTVKIAITLTLNSWNAGYGAADSLSLVLNTVEPSRDRAGHESVGQRRCRIWSCGSRRDYGALHPGLVNILWSIRRSLWRGWMDRTLKPRSCRSGGEPVLRRSTWSRHVSGY